jgi:predicted DNA-binding transcriptional regulator
MVVLVILGIGAWTGYTMTTTPPSKPIEEMSAETATEPQAENKSTTT